MGRLLLLVLAVAVLIWLLRRAVSERNAGTPPPQPPGVPDALVRCAHCGVHIPRSEATVVDAREYCGAEHARLGPGTGS